ncbi:MAG: hypothetical protein AB1690_11765 [Candidatus Zixiibacteriota bacterium]|jgi:hypothetical protein
MRYWPFLFGCLFIHISCAPAKRFPRDEGEIRKELYFCAPTKLTIKPGNRNLFLKWNTNCPPNVLLSGYNIYLLREPLDDRYLDSEMPSRIKPYNSAPYPGDTDPEGSFETMLIDNLENGTEYFVTVRTVFPDGSLSVSSNQVAAICRPEGEFLLAFRYADINDGFSFAAGKPVRADASGNDLFFFSKDGFDYISSPHRLNGFLRESQFYSLGATRDIYQHSRFSLDIPAMDRIPVRAGESYAVKTADGNYAKIRIESIVGEGKDRRMRVKYIYQTIPNLLRF